MKRTLTVAAAAIAIAAVAGAGAYIVAPQPKQDVAQKAQTPGLDRADYVMASMRMFSRVDQNGDMKISENEYAAFLLTEAELTRLNRAVEVADGERMSAPSLAHLENAAFTPDQRRTFITDVRAQYNSVAGMDGRMSLDEFVIARAQGFDMADANADGVLNGDELSAFAAMQARIMEPAAEQGPAV